MEAATAIAEAGGCGGEGGGGGGGGGDEENGPALSPLYPTPPV